MITFSAYKLNGGIVFSVRATTIALVAVSSVVSRLATGGLLLAVLLPAVTTWVRTRRMSYLRLTITAGTVLPFAVLYGRGEGWNIKDIFLE